MQQHLFFTIVGMIVGLSLIGFAQFPFLSQNTAGLSIIGGVIAVAIGLSLVVGPGGFYLIMALISPVSFSKTDFDKRNFRGTKKQGLKLLGIIITIIGVIAFIYGVIKI